MNTNRIGKYEGMFLVGAEMAQSQWDTAMKHIHDILEKRGGKIHYVSKWEERKLAFSIRRNSRGVFYLVYFEVPTKEMAAIKRDCQLSEIVLRSLFLAQEPEFDFGKVEEELKYKQGVIQRLIEEREREKEEEEEGRDFRRGGYRDHGDRGGYRDRGDRGGYRDQGDRAPRPQESVAPAEA